MRSTPFGLYKKFQIAVIEQLPNPDEIDWEIVKAWLKDQKLLKIVLSRELKDYHSRKTALEETMAEIAVKEKTYRFSKVENGKLYINLDADAFIPDSWSIDSGDHIIGGGWIEFMPYEIEDFLSKEQIEGKSIEGNNLRKIMAEQNSFNANIIDALIERSKFFPDKWKDGRRRFAWGTIYRRTNGGDAVRCLYWSNGRPNWDYLWVGDGFNQLRPAFVASLLLKYKS